MTRSASRSLIRRAAITVAAAAVLAASAACTPVEVGIGAAALAGPQMATGRNTFYWTDRLFGRSCADVSYFDRPVRCVNDG
ncbi:MAG: hypothetical protein RLO51_19480 [Thalassobaculum sp.]|uniref:hypothetical protein n=1 Tax=Thalassobaculum sp. TaxID=2022740 RepID=UPI0032EFF49A